MGRSDKRGESQFHLHQSPTTRAWPHPSNLRREAMPGQMRSYKTRQCIQKSVSGPTKSELHKGVRDLLPR